MSSGSKRKRPDANNELPRKKKTVAHVADQLKFSVIDGIAWQPAIVSTPGLEPPSNVSLDVYTRRRNGASRGSNATELLLHTSAHPKLDYTAREEDPSSSSGKLLRHYVAVYDPRTGAVQVVRARGMVMTSNLRSAPSEEEEEEEEELKSMAGARNMLGEAFGTKKSQKAIRARVENAITTPRKANGDPSTVHKLDADAEAVLGSMASVSTRQEQQLITDEAKPRPKMNLEATTPQEVFSIKELIGRDELASLNIEPWQEAVRNKTDVQTNSRFVSARLFKVAGSSNVKKTKALLYFLALLQWTQCLKSAGRDGKKLPPKEAFRENVTGVEHMVIESMRRKFANKDNTLNKRALDYLYMHFCALAIVIDSFVVDIYDLQDDLALNTKQLSQYFQELGCKVAPPTESDLKKLNIPKVAAGVHRIAKLKVPLEFPKTRLPATKKRR